MSDPAVQAAIAALEAGRPHEARSLLQAMGPAAGHDPLALQVLALLSKGPDQQHEALALLERAVRIAPGDGQAHFNLAVTLQAQGDLARAVSHYQQALALAPQHLGVLNNLSDLYRRRGRPEEGWALMQRYLALGGDAAGLEIRLAKLALDTRRLDEAEQWFQAAVRRAPADPQMAFEHAMLTLALEDYARGWAGYEARLPAYGLPALAIHPHTAPRWTGEPIAGRRLLLHREQGLGDMIMFASAFDGLIEAGADLHLAVHPPLVRLFAESFPKAKVWASVTDRPGVDQPYLKVAGPIDLQAPIASLGALTMQDGPPAPRAYLRAPAQEAQRWAGILEALAPCAARERRVGLAAGARRPRWSDDGMTNGLRKSVPPAALEPLADVAGVRWVALHDRESAALLADIPRLPIADLSPWITDLADTAAVIAQLDLVISVDTAVAHLAAAMGKPVWLLLWRNADWRWGTDRVDSAWYPNVRTFRQTARGDWTPVIEAVARALG